MARGISPSAARLVLRQPVDVAVEPGRAAPAIANFRDDAAGKEIRQRLLVELRCAAIEVPPVLRIYFKAFLGESNRRLRHPCEDLVPNSARSGRGRRRRQAPRPSVRRRDTTAGPR